MKLNKILISPVVTFGTETWIESTANKLTLCEFKTRIHGRIFEAMNDGGDWKVINNQELDELINGEGIVKFIVSEFDMLRTRAKNV
jgi:hypothetical protein